MRKKKIKAAGSQEFDFSRGGDSFSGDLPPGDESAERTVRAYSVSELNEQIRGILAASFSGDIWVYGEVYRYNLDIRQAVTRNYGQVYFELVEQNESTKKIEAAIPVMIWGKEREKIEKKLGEAGQQMADGARIKVRCSVDFYPKQGKLQLVIKDVDVEYTLGQIALARKKLLEKLAKLGLLEKNKQVPVPLVPLNVGLITSAGSAAYNDFIDELRISGYAFRVFACDARMQGRDIQRDVVASLKTLNAMEEIDVIAVIRGGGSASDLMGFDAEEIAFAIANSARPVFTGIGHQIDRTVADEVANQALKTPTAIAQFLVEKIRAYENETEDIFSGIIDRQKNLVRQKTEELLNIFAQIRSNTKTALESNKQQLNSLLAAIMKEPGRFIRQERDEISKSVENQVKILSAVFSMKNKELDNFSRQAAAHDPVNVMKRGYSVVYGTDKKVVKSISQVKAGDNIKTVVFDGAIFSEVSKKEKGE
ncbi:MAG: exodeoxyribonuclease VII large subunit [Elusimicrobia bacterium RIFOXYB2_FULL_48_7]|nr:MAG: exodeoxyribonuclease VII large subunit [Elusimicrobia bacterium RIFOXYB2_FULL_48_7]